MDTDHARLYQFPSRESPLTPAQPAARLETRAVIEQAQGIIMTRIGRTEALAFAILRAAARQGSVPVRRLAARLIARTVGHAQPPPGPGVAGHSADADYPPLVLLRGLGPDLQADLHGDLERDS